MAVLEQYTVEQRMEIFVVLDQAIVEVIVKHGIPIRSELCGKKWRSLLVKFTLQKMTLICRNRVKTQI